MSRIATPNSIATSPTAAQPLLEAVERQLGTVPNLHRLFANSPAALEGYVALNGALAKGNLDGKTRARFALVVAELNGCDYCLSAHSYLGKNLAKLDDAEMTGNREGGSADPKAAAALRFAAKIVSNRGHVTDADVAAVKAAGYNDAQLVEIVVHVGLNTITNYRTPWHRRTSTSLSSGTARCDGARLTSDQPSRREHRHGSSGA